MSSFTESLIVRHVRDGREWIVHEPFAYAVGAKTSGDVIEVPKGFPTDFASVPRGLWWLMPPAGRWAKAAVIHDFLYREGRRGRTECDRIFLEGMTVLGVRPWRKNVMYAAVRMFGWMAYRNYGVARSRGVFVLIGNRGGR